jgi:hypothetical protein
MIQNYINHIVFVVDESGSMSGLTNEVVDVFDSQIEHLARRSQEVNQETRVSVYLFSNNTKCLIYDMDVMRLPKLGKYYSPNGGTALIDGTLKAISDLKKTPELYGDHAFLIYTLTDGEENQSRGSSDSLKRELDGLPENWTFAVLVPNQRGVFEAKKFGFPSENISIWDATSAKGIKEAGRFIRESADNFFTGRSKGIRGTKTLFKLNVDVTAKEVKSNLDELSKSDYTVVNVFRIEQIRDAVENITGTFVKGSAYYQLTKPETVQSYKQICIRDKKTHKVYSGANARSLLGFPNGDVRVKPENLGKFDIFVQSTSVNRKVVPGTSIIVLK